jgi:putative FmdB family regulatory protein
MVAGNVMPIHEYACESCGSQFEKLLRRAADRESLRCPACDSAQLKQQYSSFAAAVAGSKSEAPMAGGCPAGMCATPGLCGRN